MKINISFVIIKSISSLLKIYINLDDLKKKHNKNALLILSIVKQCREKQQNSFEHFIPTGTGVNINR